ncbi:class I SAM-dependent methyltransferase [Hymenobacter metallilatus]|uniref:Class I SAM-dependent methyltransferase n=1 Tax=Hymenobacter metallilatus TaxID=2493666 RepID=A0A3R9LP56_9BACT|nr:class I SAM-dependent methyltransferase [Hymenobacter metallilatus]RSK23938.1 class I SAM-dependent methyltransferase [Hymenobacter metallilatus]
MLPSTSSTQHINQEALSLLALTNLPLEVPILDLGAGACTFLNSLLEQGYTNLIAVDVSAVALEEHRRQLSAEQVERVLWLVDDVTHAEELRLLDPILLWHDRAMLSLLGLPEQLHAYRALLDHMVEPGQGWVLLSVEVPVQAPHLGDLSRQPYSLAGLVTFLGADYALQQHREYMQQLPSGAKVPCLYALFKRHLQTTTPFRPTSPVQA